MPHLLKSLLVLSVPVLFMSFSLWEVTNMNYDEVLERIEEMQYDLEREVEWPLTETLPYAKVKQLVMDAQMALGNLYLYVEAQRVAEKV
jgi:hypothetical protein